MDEEYRISCEEDPDQAVLSVVGPAIHAYNQAQAGEGGFQRLCLALRGPDQSIKGGLTGSTCWGWLHVDLLWVSDELRGRGFGRRLLVLAEEEARRRGANHAYLDTFSFQAPGFYEKQGYQVFGELEGMPTGHHRYFLTKAL